MKGKHLAIGLLVALFGVVGLVFWFGATGEHPEVRQSSPQALSAPRAEPRSVTGYDGGTIAQTIADRRVRDELRRRILAGWAQGEGETAVAARTGRLPPMPTSPDGEVDPKYVQSVIREDMLPMAKKCYEELLSRTPDAGGRIALKFKIVGDDELGGIVEEAELDGGVLGALGDPKMETCVRESLLSLAFRPPPKDGWLTVTYPIELAPDERDR